MSRLCSRGLNLAVILFLLWDFSGCGGGRKAGPPLFPGRITLTPSSSTSLVLGGVMSFTAIAQTASGTTLSTAITYSSSDTAILNIAPNGVACAGHWDINFTTCTPGATGPVTVTANALGATSVPTYVFVHPPIDNITVTGVLLDGVPVQEPCLSQSQSMTLEAHAYSQGSDVTSSVGPFTWSANNSTVVALTPLLNSAYNFATNQVTAKAVNPGLTYIYASAGGVSSTSFQQPQLTNAQGGTSPVLDFFETCPIQNIALELNAAGSGQTSLATAKSSTIAQTVVATVTDIMGNSSLPNTTGGIVLSKVPLTWSASQPAVIGVGTGCVQSCGLTIASPGAGTVTASCSPPTCNAGFPIVPASLSTPQQVDSCTTFYHALFPQLTSCQELIPEPVYASPIFLTPPNNTQTALSPMAAISGVITGTPAAASVLAASTRCAQETPSTCSSSIYYLSTSKASAGSEIPLPVSPNSFLFDPGGVRVYMGSDFGAEVINPGNLGTSNNPYTSLGTVVGKVLAVSANGFVAAFSDTIHTPNQVYIVNTANSSVAPTALNIPSATVAAFSPDGLKAFIIGNNGNSLYIYSSLQALQGPIPLAGPANAIAFSPSGAFAYVAESAGSGPANVTAFANCNNQAVATVPLPANPILMKVLPNLQLDGQDSYGFTFPALATPPAPSHVGIHVLVLDSTGFDVVTSEISVPAPGTLCPQGLTFVSNDPARPAQRIELGQTINQPQGAFPNFFASPDGTQFYVVNPGNASILIYNTLAGAVTGGIQLQNNATPLSADFSADAGTIVITGSDGLLHEVSTANGGFDSVPLSFPNLPNSTNPFCTATPTTGPCALNVALVKP